MESYYKEEVRRILLSSPRIKRASLNTSLLMVCIMHMRVDTEEEAEILALQLPDRLTCEPYGFSISDLEADSSEMTKDLIRYWRYCRRLEFI